MDSINKMRVAIVGAGKISDIYYSNIKNRYDNLELVKCCSKHGESAKRQGEKYGVVACSFEEILADESIGLVVVLTPADTHYELIKRIVLAGKHAYTEKAFTITHEEAKELLCIADEKNVKIGASPDTFLGTPLQTAKNLIAKGVIGEVSGVTVTIERNLNMLYGHMRFLLGPGGDILGDFSPYYLNALLDLFGPVARVSCMQKINRPNRKSTVTGEEFEVKTENVGAAILQFENGLIGSMMMDGDSIVPEQHHFIIYGTEGVLYLPNMDHFNGEVRLQKNVDGAERLMFGNPQGLTPKWLALEENKKVIEQLFGSVPQPVELLPGPVDDQRGIGVSEMGDAIMHGRRPAACGERAAHVVEIIEGFRKSSECGQVYTLRSTI